MLSSNFFFVLFVVVQKYTPDVEDNDETLRLKCLASQLVSRRLALVKARRAQNKAHSISLFLWTCHCTCFQDLPKLGLDLISKEGLELFDDDCSFYVGQVLYSILTKYHEKNVNISVTEETTSETYQTATSASINGGSKEFQEKEDSEEKRQLVSV